MKKIMTLFSFLTLFLFAINTYAYGPGVKVLSSKIEMSPGLQGGFKENASIPPQLLANGGAEAFSQAGLVSGKKAENILIKGSHAFIIENRTGRTQSYVIEYKLSLYDGRFIRKTDIIMVNDNSVAKGSAISYTNQYFPTAGRFRFTVETFVRGEHNAYKSDNNFVLVS